MTFLYFFSEKIQIVDSFESDHYILKAATLCESGCELSFYTFGDSGVVEFLKRVFPALGNVPSVYEFRVQVAPKFLYDHQRFFQSGKMIAEFDFGRKFFFGHY